jgi:hypothetical protein
MPDKKGFCIGCGECVVEEKCGGEKAVEDLDEAGETPPVNP